MHDDLVLVGAGVGASHLANEGRVGTFTDESVRVLPMRVVRLFMHDQIGGLVETHEAVRTRRAASLINLETILQHPPLRVFHKFSALILLLVNIDQLLEQPMRFGDDRLKLLWQSFIKITKFHIYFVCGQPRASQLRNISLQIIDLLQLNF